MAIQSQRAVDFLRKRRGSSSDDEVPSEDKLSFLQRITETLSRPERLFANLQEAALTGRTEPIKEGLQAYNPVSVYKTLVHGVPQPEEERTTFEEALKAGGVPELGSLKIPSIRKNPETALIHGITSRLGLESPEAIKKIAESKTDPFTVTGRGAIGLAESVLADPLTYLTFGTGTAPEVGGKVLSRAGIKALKTAAPEAAEQIGKELAVKGIELAPEALAKAGRTRAERFLAKRIESGERKITDVGGIKFAGKPIVSGETVEKITKPIGETIEKIPGAKSTREFLSTIFKREPSTLPTKASESFGKYYTRVEAKKDEVVDKLVNVFKPQTGKIISQGEREQIFETLAKAEDRSKGLLSERATKLGASADEVGQFQKDIDDIAKLSTDPDIPVRDLKDYHRKLKTYHDISKKTGIQQVEFDKILAESIRELPAHLQEPARKVSLLLKQGAKKDVRAGLLPKLLPNYVPRKYVNLKDVVPSGPSTGVGGEITKTLGGRIRHRKIETLEGARQFAEEMGGELVEDVAVPVAERLVRGVKAREANVLTQELRKVYGEKLPPIVESHLRQITSRGTSNPVLATAVNAYDKVLNIYKGSLTGMFPAFHARNIISNRFLSYLGVGSEALNPVAIKHGIDISRNSKGAIKTILGDTIPYDVIRKEASKNGVMKGFFLGDITETIPEKISGRLSKNPIKIGRTVGQAIENADRLTLYTSFLKKGFSYKDAAKQVNKFLFDYNNLSTTEKTVFRRIFPFYTFNRKAVELFSKELIKQPRTFETLDDLRTFLQGEQMSTEEMAKLPSWLKNRIVVKSGKNQYISGIDLGFENIAQTLSDPKEVLSQISPPAKFALEQGIKRDIFRDKSLAEAAQNIRDIPPPILESPIGKILGVKKKRVGGKTVYSSSSPRLIHLLRNLPTSRLMSTAASPFKEDVSPLESIVNILTGVREQKFEPSYLSSLKKKEKQKRMSEEGKGRELKVFTK